MFYGKMENPFKSRPHFLEIFGQDSVCVCVSQTLFQREVNFCS